MARVKEKKKGIMAWLLLSLAAITILSFYIWHQAKSFQLGIEISRQEAEIAQLQKEIERLEIEKASLESLDLVERIARDRLNLHPPRPDQVFYERKAPKDENSEQ